MPPSSFLDAVMIHCLFSSVNPWLIDWAQLTYRASSRLRLDIFMSPKRGGLLTGPPLLSTLRLLKLRDHSGNGHEKCYVRVNALFVRNARSVPRSVTPLF